MDKKVFDTDKRIKLGIWGLGRGGNFIKCASALNIDVVAGCDFCQEIRDRFVKNNPDVFVTDDEDEFLAQDIDAVLVATWFPDHAEHCIKVLNAGKHVMCEVTSFMTPADGVRLVEAVERSGKVYNLLENYPFMMNNMLAKKLWQDGLFGDFVYGEYDYNHDCRTLAFAYNTWDSAPVEPGCELHNWRSWLNGHYYNTHSLGPVMQITGLRPIEVTASPIYGNQPGTAVKQPGMIGDGLTGPCLSIVRMSNGGILRNLMGGLSHDTHSKRIWGTKGAFDFGGDFKVYLGASGHGASLNLKKEWPDMGELAETMGHGGGDFWELYYFARQILTGEKAPWDIYSACDVCLAGIMSVKSQQQGGITVPVPDFRDPAVREQYRNDHFIQEHFDPKTVLFPQDQDHSITDSFNTVMTGLLQAWKDEGTILVRETFDGMKLYPRLADDTSRITVIKNVRRLIDALDTLKKTYLAAHKIIDAYPDSLGANILRNTLDVGEEEKILNPEKTRQELTDWLLQIQ